MSFHVYKKIELVGSSDNSIEDAITYYQVTVRVGFRLNESAD